MNDNYFKEIIIYSFVLYEQFILFAYLYFSTALSQDIINIKNKSDKYDE